MARSGKSEAYKRAREIYDEFVQRPGEFVVESVKLVMRTELEPYQDEAFSALIEDAYSKAEGSQKSKADSRQKTLFDIGGVLILESNRRVGKRHAMLSHFDEHLKFSDANRDAVDAANDREHRIRNLLRPYWGPGVTMQQAIEQYRSEHPDADDVAA